MLAPWFATGLQSNVLPWRPGKHMGLNFRCVGDGTQKRIMATLDKRPRWTMDNPVWSHDLDESSKEKDHKSLTCAD